MYQYLIFSLIVYVIYKNKLMYKLYNVLYDYYKTNKKMKQKLDEKLLLKYKNLLE